jgi:YidC/Oxa1 family membrane protein insertase
MYKNDRAKLQEEIINLYKRYHVNPAAGCLPLILQLPIFIALYSTLMSAVELRGAHFILWIKDLSSPDPLYILPLLMGGTSLLYQLKTIIDPQQKRMALLFTGVFTLIFLTFPAGLNLYWLTQNLLSIFETKILAERKKSPSYLTKKTSVQK